MTAHAGELKRDNMHRPSVLALLSLLGLMQSIALSVADTQGVTIDDLVRQAADRRSRLTGVRMAWVMQQRAGDDGRYTPELSTISRSISHDLVGRRYQINRDCAFGNGKEHMTGAFASNGEVFESYAPTAKLGILDDKPTIESRSELSYVQYLMLEPPQPGGLGIDDCSLESLLVNSRLRPELEMVNGRLCYVVDAYLGEVHYASAWLDVERDSMPVRHTSIGPTGEIVGDVTLLEAKNYAAVDGSTHWIPIAWTQLITFGADTITQTIQVDADSVKLNPRFVEGDFNIAFPPGTRILDRVSDSDVYYQVADNGEWNEVDLPRDEIQVIENNTPPPAPVARDAAVHVYVPSGAANAERAEAGAAREMVAPVESRHRAPEESAREESSAETEPPATPQERTVRLQQDTEQKPLNGGRSSIESSIVAFVATGCMFGLLCLLLWRRRQMGRCGNRFV